MLLWLTAFLSNYYRAFHVFQYLTLRAILASLTAFLISLLLAPKMIRTLSYRQIGQAIRTDGPQAHLSKAGTPTMGGALILIAIVMTILLWANLNNHLIWIVLLGIVGFGLIGFADDYLKLMLKNSRGLIPRWKYLWQSTLGLTIGVLLYMNATLPVETQLVVPFFKNLLIPLGIFYIPWVYFVIVGSSNAVNLTDGLDGLAIMPTVLVGGGLGIFAYLTGNITYAKYLAIPFIPGAGEMVVICGAIVGAGLGFLWFNTYPAQVFMGDVGALALGGALGTIAVIVRQEIVLFIMGGIFVVETLSVMIQVSWFKYTKKKYGEGRRIFKMAPLHHHFEAKGWPSYKVTMRYWIFSLVCAILGITLALVG